MIASRLGLAIVCALALLLGLVLGVDTAREAPVTDRALVPGFDEGAVTALAWSGGPALRESSAGWQWASDGAPAEQTAVDAVLAALRGAQWHRRERGAEPAASTELRITQGARTTTLQIGAPIAGGAQTWIARDGHRLLVDDWVVRALVPPPLSLRVTKPFAAAASASRLVLERASDGAAIRIEGTPRRLVKPQRYLLAAPASGTLERALAELEIVALLPAGAPASPAAWTISVDAPRLVTIEIGGRCPAAAHVAIAGTAGRGCVARTAVEAIERAALAAIDPARSLEARPLPIDPVRIVLPDGGVLELAKRPRLGDRDADPARVGELLGALATPAALVARPPAAPVGTLTLTDAEGTAHALALFADRVVARADEPRALRLAAAADAIVRRPSTALVDPTLWSEEPTTIATVTVDGTTYTRGAVLGEWQRRGPGADLPGVVEQLAAQLAAPRSLGTHATIAVAHTLAITTAPPSGAPVTRMLQLVRLPRGCGAIVGGARHLIAPEICALVARLR